MQNPISMIQKFQTFAQNFQKLGKSPQQAVQELLNSGQMSQAQFQQLSQMATQIFGRKPF